MFVIILILSHVVVVVPVSLLPISIVGFLIVLSYRPDRLIVGGGSGRIVNGEIVTGVISIVGVLMVLSYRPDRYIVGGRGKIMHGDTSCPGRFVGFNLLRVSADVDMWYLAWYCRMPCEGSSCLSILMSKQENKESGNKIRSKVHPRPDQTMNNAAKFIF